MLKRLFFILSLFSYSYCFATVLVQESTIVPAEQYHELAKQYANKASYYNTMAGLYESQTLSLTSPICTNFYESSLQLKPYNPWLGTQFGFGAGGANGDTTNSSINGSAIVNYKPESGAAGWQYNTIGQYDYLNTYGSSANKNRLYMQQNGAYMYDKYNGVFAQASYLNDANDGYYYVWNENIGYKLQIINNDLMGLQFSLGPGLQQVQVVSSNIAGTQAQWLTQLTYNLNLNNILTFYEQLQNTATQLNTTTYSISTLNLQIDKNFGIGVNYQITYNSNPPIGKSSTNAISSINLIYGIN
jgi:putative salt-induced outer membrane protein